MAFLSLSPQGATLTVDELTSSATHIGLFSADPIAAGNLASEQPAANGYARQPITWSTVSAGVKQNSADILWEAQGAAWNQGPWYIVLMSASTSGDPLAIVVDEDGIPQTTFDIAGVNGLQDTQRLKIPANNLMVGAGLPPLYADLDPITEILAMSPTLFWVFDRLDAIPGTYMWQDSAKTTPVTANGQPVGCVADLVQGHEAVQATSGRRPDYAAGVGIEFSGNGELIPGDLSGVVPQTSSAPATQDTDLYGYGVGWVTDSGEGNQCALNVSSSATGMIARNSLAAAVWGETTTDVCTLADSTYDDQRLDVYSNGCWARGTTYCAQSGAVVFRNVSTGAHPDSVVFGNYQPGNGSYMITGTISYVVFFDRLLNIPELAKLQRMLLKIGQ